MEIVKSLDASVHFGLRQRNISSFKLLCDPCMNRYEHYSDPKTFGHFVQKWHPLPFDLNQSIRSGTLLIHLRLAAMDEM